MNLVELCQVLRSSEDWLLARVLARAQAPAAHLAALEEVWHQSFLGLTGALVETLEAGGQDAPAKAFGILEAKRHRERGVSLEMLLSLLDLYRPAYLDLVRERLGEGAGAAAAAVDRFFDRIEVAFCRAWAREAETGGMQDLEARNFALVAERDRYITVFESLPLPILLLGPDLSVQNLNHAAAMLILGRGIPGAWHYEADKTPAAAAILRLFPGFQEAALAFRDSGLDRQDCEWTTEREGRTLTFRVLLARMLDLPRVFAGILVAFDDQTERLQATQEREQLIGELTRSMAEIRQLSGLLPICAWCKKIRDDQGYWAQVESYFSSRTGVMFSHSVCPECAERLRQELHEQIHGEDRPGQKS